MDLKKFKPKKGIKLTIGGKIVEVAADAVPFIKAKERVNLVDELKKIAKKNLFNNPDYGTASSQ